MEITKTHKDVLNWANDFTISENIAEFASDLIGIYSRICSNNPNHKDYKEWNERSLEWSRYFNSRPDHFFPTEKSAEEEVNRLVQLRKEALEIERNLRS